jgi:hypothetical protein
MKYLAATLLACIAVGGAFGIAPPVDPPVSPAIVPSGGPPGPVDPNGGTPPNVPLNTPEPASFTILGLGLAAAGTYRFVRRLQLP